MAKNRHSQAALAHASEGDSHGQAVLTYFGADVDTGVLHAARCDMQLLRMLVQLGAQVR